MQLKPGLQPLLHLGNGADIGSDLLGDGGQVGVFLLQLEKVMELGLHAHVGHLAGVRPSQAPREKHGV